jgi:hypothetical protein
MREAMKAEIRERFRGEVPAGLRQRAERLYETFAPADAETGERP